MLLLGETEICFCGDTEVRPTLEILQRSDLQRRTGLLSPVYRFSLASGIHYELLLQLLDLTLLVESKPEKILQVWSGSLGERIEGLDLWGFVNMKIARY